MKTFRFGLPGIILLLSVHLYAQNVSRQEGIYADFSTNKGRISVLLEHKKAPMTVANFIGLTEGTITNSTYPPGKPFFNGSIWHRVVKGHVIQGGEPSVVKDPANSEVISTGYEIPNEISTLSHNKAGMIGMANGGPHTNTCQYYITLADRSYLDGNYTLFGEVVDGMEVVNKIEMGDTTYSISIVRVGKEAENFIVNDETFKKLLDRQWKKVKDEKAVRTSKEAKFIKETYPGLITLPDGLRYKVLKEGSGAVPSSGEMLDVSYTGRLINGVQFASTSDGGKPAGGSNVIHFVYESGKDGILKGLQLSISSMKSGEKRLVIIPPSLGYGEKNGFYGKEIPGQKRFVISPGETLIIEVTLNKISPPTR